MHDFIASSESTLTTTRWHAIIGAAAAIVVFATAVTVGASQACLAVIVAATAGILRDTTSLCQAQAKKSSDKGRTTHIERMDETTLFW